MMAFTDRELALMQEAQEDAMPHTVDVERQTRNDDGFGGTTGNTWAAVESAIVARITKAQTLDLGGQAGRKLEIEKHTVRLPVGTDVVEGDRIKWGSVYISVDEVQPRGYNSVVTVSGEKVK